MKAYKAKIKGTVRIQFFRDIGDEDGKVGRRSPEEYKKQAQLRVYRNKDGLYCPSANIKRAIRVAAGMANIKINRRGADQYLNALMFIDPLEIPFGKDEPDFIDERMGRIPPGPKGSRVMLYRPGLNAGWELSFTVLLGDECLTGTMVEQVISAAGGMVGICNGRPEFGRFVLTEWKELKEKKV